MHTNQFITVAQLHRTGFVRIVGTSVVVIDRITCDSVNKTINKCPPGIKHQLMALPVLLPELEPLDHIEDELVLEGVC